MAGNDYYRLLFLCDVVSECIARINNDTIDTHSEASNLQRSRSAQCERLRALLNTLINIQSSLDVKMLSKGFIRADTLDTVPTTDKEQVLSMISIDLSDGNVDIIAEATANMDCEITASDIYYLHATKKVRYHSLISDLYYYTYIMGYLYKLFMYSNVAVDA